MGTRTRIAAATAVAALTAGAYAVAPATASTADAAPTTQAKRLDRAALQARLQGFVDAGAVGATAYVSGPNGSWSSSAGVAQRNPRVPATGGEKARVASNTKSMVATVALQEVEKGTLSLDTTVDEVLPGAIPGHGDVTLEQLLSHRSGMPDYLLAVMTGETVADFRKVVERTVWTDSRLLAAANTLPWNFEPGTDFAYSNSNYIVVGIMLEAITGHTVQQLLHDRVFVPAGMTQSSFPTASTMPGRNLAEYYTWDRLRPLEFQPTLFSSAGAVVAPARDLDRFWDALMTGRLLQPATVDDMLTPRSTDVLAYGLGTYALPDPCPAADGSPQLLHGHDGGAYGTLSATFSTRDAARQVSVAWTGRDLSGTQPLPPVNEFLSTALVATCQTAVTGAPSLRLAPQGATGPDAFPGFVSLTPATRG